MEKRQGAVHVVVGPMFAGKTSELFRRKRRCVIGGKKTVLVKFSGDYRYPTESASSVLTHLGDRERADMVCDYLGLDGIPWTVCALDDVHSVFVDEGQFFDADQLVEFCEALATRHGKVVTVAGLDTNYRRKPYRGMATLMASAESVTKLTAVCGECGADASFSHRLCSSDDNEREFSVGGADKYMAACRACHARLSSSTTSSQ